MWRAVAMCRRESGSQHPVACSDAYFCKEGGDPVTAAQLRRIQSLIRGFDELLRSDLWSRDDTAAAEGDGDDAVRIAFVLDVHLFDPGANHFRCFGNAARAGPGHHDYEFLASEACGEVAGPHSSALYGCRDSAQAVVSRKMTVDIIEELEAIDIDHHERYGFAVTHGPTPFLFKHRVEAAAIGEAGETVTDGESFHPFIGMPGFLFEVVTLKQQDADREAHEHAHREKDLQGRDAVRLLYQAKRADVMQCSLSRDHAQNVYGNH